MANRTMTPEETIAALQASRWWQPTIQRYQVHVDACNRLECPELLEPFQRFADEVINAPEEIRDAMLAVEELEEYLPFQRYPAYVEPIMSEQKLGFYSAETGSKMGARISQRRTK